MSGPTDSVRKVRVLINPRSGFHFFGVPMQQVFREHWDVPGTDLTYQISHSVEDGRAKTVRALDDGIDTLIVVGGDGMVNTIGSLLIGRSTALGVVPAGTGNGFARHFGIPLDGRRAAAALARAEPRGIDVATANGRPFFVTCCMAWDAALADRFEKSTPVRGILPYVMAAAYGLVEYAPQPFRVACDGAPATLYRDPMVFTVANLTQYGGGAQIAPSALADDGFLELVSVARADAPRVLAGIGRLFDGTIGRLGEVQTRRFRRMVVRRARGGPIALDGEIVESGPEVVVEILPRALTVLVPRK